METKTYFEYPNYENIKDIIYHVAYKYPDNVAFIVKNKAENGEVTYKNITYVEFLEDVNNLGAALYSLGLNDKKVAFISKNRYEWVLAYVTTLLGNMIAIPLDKGLKKEEVESSILRSNPDCIFYGKEILESIDYLKENNDVKNIKFVSMEAECDSDTTVTKLLSLGKQIREEGSKVFEEAQIDNEKTSIYCFTSGTSAVSKIVMLSQKNIAFNICAMQQVENFLPTDTNLQFLPLHHMFGSTGVLTMMAAGMRTAFPDGLRYIQANMKEYEVSVFVGVPILVEAIYKKIEKEVQKQNKEKLIKVARKVTNLVPGLKRKVFKQILDQLGGKLRLVVSGAAALDKDVWLAFNEMGIRVLQGYGLTEASPVVSAENYKIKKQGSIGVPLPGIECKIIDKNEFGIGELITKGNNVMKGYFQNDEANKETFTEDGWLKTGDLGYIDKKGCIFITGRKKNVIVLKNGKNIFPEELESVINKLPIVNECMIFGLEQDDDLIVSVKIQYDSEYVKETYPDISEEELYKIVWNQIKEINKLLPTYKYIKKMFLTKEDFIKTTTSKIKRYEEIKKINNN